MSILKSTRTAIAAGVIAAVIGAAIVVFLVVRPDNADAETTGTCDARGAFAELSVEREDSGQEVSAELAGAEPGETWKVSLRQGDTVLMEGTRTADEEGELDIDAYTRDGSVDDKYTFEATNKDGATCTASVN